MRRETDFIVVVTVMFRLIFTACPQTWSSVVLKSHEIWPPKNPATLLLKTFLQPFLLSKLALKNTLIRA